MNKPPFFLVLILLVLSACAAPQPNVTQAAAPQQGATQAAAPTAAPSTPRGYITFAVNVHDWVHSDQSAETLLRLIDTFERYGIHGDFYLTAPVTRELAEKYPEVIRRLNESGMTISYHVRAPHPLVQGFGTPLTGLNNQALYQAILDYETYRLDMETGGLDRSQPGGYTYVTQVFGRKPVVASAAGADPRVTAVARQVYADLGAQMTIQYHESGAKIEQPFEYIDNLLIRPSDFSVTRTTAVDNGTNFWWNYMGRPDAEKYTPLNILQSQLDDWEAQNNPRPPFITSLVHENNFYRSGSAAWGSYYYQIDAHGNKGAPLSPPFDLSAPDPSTLRSSQEQDAIWQAYEAMVAWAAANLQVVTSEDIVQMQASGSLPPEVPADFQAMLDFTPSGQTYYIAPEQSGANNVNDGLSPDFQGDGHGPWLDFSALSEHAAQLGPGDALILRQGIYQTGEKTLSVSFSGSAQAPILIAAYPGEQAILRAGYDPVEWADRLQNRDSPETIRLGQEFGKKPILRLTGKYVVIEGLTLENCYMVCIHFQGQHSILANNIIRGSIEDGIKFSDPAQDNLVWGNEFSGFGDQAIDVWGTREVYIVSNEFHHSNEDLPWGVGAPVWTKGGSENIYYLENYFHDLTVKDHALNLGGCCWYNWAERSRDEAGNLLPVASHVYAYRNTFENITIMPDSPDRFPGVIGVEGCQECAASQNLIRNSDDAFGIHATTAEGQRMPAANITLTENTLVNIRTGRLYNIAHDAIGLTIDHNTYISTIPLTCRIQDRELSFDEWRSEGYDSGSNTQP